MRARRLEVQKKSDSGGIRRNTGLCERRKEYGAVKRRKRGPSYRARWAFRQSLCFVVTISAAKRPSTIGRQLASVVVNEDDEAYTTNLCQKCFTKHLQAKGEDPLTNMK